MLALPDRENRHDLRVRRRAQVLLAGDLVEGAIDLRPQAVGDRHRAADLQQLAKGLRGGDPRPQGKHQPSQDDGSRVHRSLLTLR